MKTLGQYIRKGVLITTGLVGSQVNAGTVGEGPQFTPGSPQEKALKELIQNTPSKVAGILSIPASAPQLLPSLNADKNIAGEIKNLRGLTGEKGYVEVVKKFWDTIPNPELWLSLIGLTTIGGIALGRRHIANKKTNEKDQLDEIRRSLNPGILRVAEDFIKILSRKEFNGEYEVLTIDQDKHIGYRLKGGFGKENYLIITNNGIQYVSMFDEDDISIRLKKNTPKKTLEELIRDTLPTILLSDDIGSDTFMPDVDFEVFIGFKEYKILLKRFLGDPHYTGALKKWCQDRDNLDRLRSIFEKGDSDDATASHVDYQEIKRKIREIDERILKEKDLINRSINDIERIFEKLTPEQREAVLSGLGLTEEVNNGSEVSMSPKIIYNNILAVESESPHRTIDELETNLNLLNGQKTQAIIEGLRDIISDETDPVKKKLFIGLFQRLKGENDTVYSNLKDEEKNIIDEIIELGAVQKKGEEKEVPPSITPQPSAPNTTSSKQGEGDLTQPMELDISPEDLEQRFDPEPITLILGSLEAGKEYSGPMREWVEVLGLIEKIKRTLSDLEFLVIRMYEFSQKKYVNLQFKSKTELITRLAQDCTGFDHMKVTDFLRFIEDRKNMFDPEIYEAVRRVFLGDSSTTN